MPVPFDSYDLDQAEEIVRDRIPDGAEVSRKFYEGDHWQDAEGWSGPIPDKSTGEKYRATRDKIHEAFESKNVIKEVVDRRRDGVLGTKPRWSVNLEEEAEGEDGSSDSQAEMIEEAERLLSFWWDERDFQQVLQEAEVMASHSERAVLRLYIPPDLLERRGGEDGDEVRLVVPNGDMEDQLDRIHVDVVGPEQGIVWEHPDTKKEVGIYAYEEEVEPEEGPESRTRDVVEMTYLAENGNTVLRRITNEGDRRFELDFDGHLTMVQIEHETFVSEQVRQTQKSLNMTKTLMSRNEVSGAFLERLFLNAQPPVDIVEHDDRPDEVKLKDFSTGPATTNWIKGVEVKNEEGNVEKLASPEVVFREPSDSTVFTDAKKEKRKDILDEVGQTFIMMQSTGDARTSGRSRIIARHEFKKTLDTAAVDINDAAQEGLETALAMAAQFAGQTSPFDGLRVSFAAKVDTGPLSAEEREAIRKDVQEGLTSVETAMRQLGIQDVQAELERIDTVTKRAREIFNTLGAANIQSRTLTKKLVRQILEEKLDEIPEDEMEEIMSDIETSFDRQDQAQPNPGLAQAVG